MTEQSNQADRLSAIDTLIVEKIFKQDEVLSLSNIIINEIVNVKKGNIIVPNKLLSINIMFMDIPDSTGSNNVTKAYLYNQQNTYYTEFIHRNMRKFINADPDVIKMALIPLIYELRRKISCFNPFIRDTTYGIGGHEEFDLFNNKLLNHIMDNLHEPVETIIQNIVKPSSSAFDIHIIVYASLLLYYTKLCDNKIFISYIRDYFTDCIKNKKIGFIRVRLMTQKEAHAVAVVFNGITKIVEYFDPNGDTSILYNRKFIQALFKKILGPLFTRFTHFHPKYTKDDIEYIYNIQSNPIGSALDKKFDLGICGLYTTWFLVQRLTNLQKYSYSGIPHEKYISQSKEEYLKYASFYLSKKDPNPAPFPSPDKQVTTDIYDYNWNDAAQDVAINDINVIIDRHYDILEFGKTILKMIKIKIPDKNQLVSIWGFTKKIRKEYDAKRQANVGLSDQSSNESVDQEIIKKLGTTAKAIKNIIADEQLYKCSKQAEPIKDTSIYLLNELARFNQRYYLAIDGIDVSNLHKKENSGIWFNSQINSKSSKDSNLSFYLSNELRMLEMIVFDD